MRAASHAYADDDVRLLHRLEASQRRLHFVRAWWQQRKAVAAFRIRRGGIDPLK